MKWSAAHWTWCTNNLLRAIPHRDTLCHSPCGEARGVEMVTTLCFCPVTHGEWLVAYSTLAWHPGNKTLLLRVTPAYIQTLKDFALASLPLERVARTLYDGIDLGHHTLALLVVNPAHLISTACSILARCTFGCHAGTHGPHGGNFARRCIHSSWQVYRNIRKRPKKIAWDETTKGRKCRECRGGAATRIHDVTDVNMMSTRDDKTHFRHHICDSQAVHRALNLHVFFLP
jgi:hypothetical protein